MYFLFHDLIFSRTKRAFEVKSKLSFQVSQVLSVTLEKQTSKNVADKTFKTIKTFDCSCFYGLKAIKQNFARNFCIQIRFLFTFTFTYFFGTRTPPFLVDKLESSPQLIRNEVSDFIPNI